MNFKPGDKVYCHTNHRYFIKGNTYTISYLNTISSPDPESLQVNYIMMNSGTYLCSFENELFGHYFINIKELRKMKLKKLENEI